MKSHLYKNKEEAKEAAKQLGCEGYHKSKRNTYKPCRSNEELLETENNGDNKVELEELVDFDGTLNSSKIPFLNPATTAPGWSTMDKRVASGHQTQDPLTRGYRVYYGESVVREEDMSGAFGYDETENMDGEETVEYFVKKLGFDKENAKERTEELGKDPEGKLDEKSRFKNKKGFVGKLRLKEKKYFTKEEIMKMSEELVFDKSDDNEIRPKDSYEEEISPVLLRNLTALKNMANAEGISIPKLIDLIKKS
jgi:hypothetical protein